MSQPLSARMSFAVPTPPVLANHLQGVDVSDQDENALRQEKRPLADAIKLEVTEGSKGRNHTTESINPGRVWQASKSVWLLDFAYNKLRTPRDRRSGSEFRPNITVLDVTSANPVLFRALRLNRMTTQQNALGLIGLQVYAKSCAVLAERK